MNITISNIIYIVIYFHDEPNFVFKMFDTINSLEFVVLLTVSLIRSELFILF